MTVLIEYCTRVFASMLLRELHPLASGPVATIIIDGCPTVAFKNLF